MERTFSFWGSGPKYSGSVAGELDSVLPKLFSERIWQTGIFFGGSFDSARRKGSGNECGRNSF